MITNTCSLTKFFYLKLMYTTNHIVYPLIFTKRKLYLIAHLVNHLS